MEKIPYLRCKKCYHSSPQKIVDNQGVVLRIPFTIVTNTLSATQKEEYYKCTSCGSDNVEKIGARLYADIKETCWRRIHFELPNGVDEEKVIQEIKENGPDIAWDYEVDSETDDYESMNVQDNNGCSTVELYYDNGTLIWENGKNAGASADRAASKSLENVEIL